MKKKKNFPSLSLSELARLLCAAYTVGIAAAIWFWIGCLLRRVKILHKERLQSLKSTRKLIVVCNHPSIIDPFLVAAMVFCRSIFNPLHNLPIVMADRIIFYDSPWFWILRPAMVSVERGNNKKEASALMAAIRAVEQHRIVIIFPEGGRTFRGEEGKFLYSQKGNDLNAGKIRMLKGGTGLLVRKTGAVILPVGIKGSDKLVPNSKKKLWTYFVPWEKVTLNIGHPISFEPDATREDITQILAARLLDLVDEML